MTELNTLQGNRMTKEDELLLGLLGEREFLRRKVLEKNPDATNIMFEGRDYGNLMMVSWQVPHEGLPGGRMAYLWPITRPQDYDIPEIK